MESRKHIDISGIKFIGIGKLLFTSTEKWNIPQLHFLISEEDGVFETVNLEMQLFATGESESEAVANLVDLTISHIQKVMEVKDLGFSQFVEDAKSLVLEEYWSKYREFEFIASENRESLSNNIEQRINYAIMAMFVEFLKEQGAFENDNSNPLGVPRVMYKRVA